MKVLIDLEPHAPGIAGAAQMPGGGNIVSAHGSMNHLAFDVPADIPAEIQLKMKKRRLIANAIMCSSVMLPERCSAIRRGETAASFRR